MKTSLKIERNFCSVVLIILLILTIDERLADNGKTRVKFTPEKYRVGSEFAFENKDSLALGESKHQKL